MRPLRRLLACSLLVVLVASGSALADPGDPQKRFNRADQTRAKAMLLRLADLPSGFRATPPAPDTSDFYCKPLDESDLTLSGEAESRRFQGGLAFASSVAQVYVTAADANTSWRRGTSAAGRRCVEEAFREEVQKGGASLESFGTIAFPRVAERSIAFRLVLAQQGVRVVIDVVLMQHGRAQTAVFVGSGIAPAPKSEEVRLARLVAGRMARAMRG